MMKNAYMEKVLEEMGSLTIEELNKRCSECPDELTVEQENYYIAMIDCKGAERVSSDEIVNLDFSSVG